MSESNPIMANTIDVVEVMARSIWDGDGLLDSDEARDIATGCLKALRSAGYVVVPVEPTEAMVEAGAYGSSVGVAAGVWVAMIAAAEGGE